MNIRIFPLLVFLAYLTLPVTHSRTPVVKTLLAGAVVSQLASNADLAISLISTAGVTDLSFPEWLGLSLATAVLILPSSYCDAYPAYKYDNTYNICYKVVRKPRLTVTDATSACNADGPNAQLIRINSNAIYDFVQEQIDVNGLCITYFQGKRATVSDPFLYDDGTPVTYFRWDSGEPGTGSNQLYLRTDTTTGQMETTAGTIPRSYICAVYP